MRQIISTIGEKIQVSKLHQWNPKQLIIDSYIYKLSLHKQGATFTAQVIWSVSSWQYYYDYDDTTLQSETVTATRNISTHTFYNVRILCPIHLKSVPHKASGRTNDQEQHVSCPMLERTLS